MRLTTVEVQGYRFRVSRAGAVVRLLVDLRVVAPAGRRPRWERAWSETKSLTPDEARQLAVALEAAAGGVVRS